MKYVDTVSRFQLIQSVLMAMLINTHCCQKCLDLDLNTLRSEQQLRPGVMVCLISKLKSQRQDDRHKPKDILLYLVISR